jgi:hypothetical protein
MNRVEKFRNCIMDASGRVRRVLIAEHGNLHFGFGEKFYSRPHDYVLGWFRHPNSDKKVYEVTYQPNWGVKCSDLVRGSNGAAHDIATMVPEGYEWEENSSPFNSLEM